MSDFPDPTRMQNVPDNLPLLAQKMSNKGKNDKIT
jgi:hypothetical protein